MTTVDVIIPYSTEFSTEEELDRAISSVEEQDVKTETIVIDEVIEDEDINGASWARNRGLEESENRYVAFLDADDYWREEKLSKQLDELKKSGAGICLTRPEIDEDPNPVFNSEKFPKQLAYGKWVSLTSSIIIDSDKVSTKFDESIYRFEDHLFILKAISESSFSFLDDRLTVVNKTEEGMSANEDFDRKFDARKKFFEELAGDYDFIPDARGHVMAKNLRWKGRELYFDKEYEHSISYYKKSMKEERQLKTLMAYLLSLSKVGLQKVI